MQKQLRTKNKKFELMLTRRAKAYSGSSSVVTHCSTNRARRRVTSFQSKRVTNYATPPMPLPWHRLVNDLDLRSPKTLKSLTPTCARLHEPRGSGLRLLKSTFNAENFIHRLSWSNSSHFVAIQHWNVRSIQILQKNSLKTPFGKVQGHSRSSMLINLKSLSPVLVMISSMSVPICNRAYATRDNCGKITTF